MQRADGLRRRPPHRATAPWSCSSARCRRRRREPARPRVRGAARRRRGRGGRGRGRRLQRATSWATACARCSPTAAIALVVDLSATTYLDSAGINLLFAARRRPAQRQQRLHLVCRPAARRSRARSRSPGSTSRSRRTRPGRRRSPRRGRPTQAGTEPDAATLGGGARRQAKGSSPRSSGQRRRDSVTSHRCDTRPPAGSPRRPARGPDGGPAAAIGARARGPSWSPSPVRTPGERLPRVVMSACCSRARRRASTFGVIFLPPASGVAGRRPL